MPPALYRRYRPKTFADVIGQSAVVTVLMNAARRDTLAHAYLLYGPRGTGKTTLARLIAKVANCTTRIEDKKFRDKGEPCNRCSPCLEIDAGRALDVVEIDAASNRGIDEIRALKEHAALVPAAYQRKVFIIDETHQLTKEAFNALLKILEEPPAHILFVLATTEFEKVPATVASRTQRFHLKKLSTREVLEKLKHVVKDAKLSVADDALEVVAAAADGSLRDAESLLDQLTSLENEVSVESVEAILGRAGFKRTATLAHAILTGKLSEALSFLSMASEEGYNIVDLTRELIHYLRRVLTIRADVTLGELFKAELTDKEYAQLIEHAKLADPAKLVLLIRSLIRAYSDMRYSPFAPIPLEVALIEHLRS